MTFLKKFRATRLGGDRNLHKSPSDTFKVNQPLPHGTLAHGTLEMAAVTVIVLLAAILRLNDITAQSLSFDEAYTRLVVSFSYQTIFTVPFDVHPPLFYALTKALAPSGPVEAEIRTMAALAGVVTVLPIWAGVRRLFGPVGGLTAAAFFAVSALHVNYSQDARPYSLTVLFLTGVVIACLRLVSAAPVRGVGVPPGLALGYAATAILALYTHTIALVFLAAINLAIMVVMVMELRQTGWRRPLYWGAINIAVLAMWFPRAVVIRSTSSDFSWLEQPGLHHAAGLWLRAVGVSGAPDAVTVLAALAVLAGLPLLVLRGKWKIALVLAAVTVAFPLLVWAAGFAKPILLQRTLLPVTIGASILCGALAASAVTLSPIWRRTLGTLVGAAIAVNAAMTVSGAGKHQRENWRALGNTVTALTESGAPVLLCGPAGHSALLPYTRNADPLQIWWPSHSVFTGVDAEAVSAYVALPNPARTAMDVADLEAQFPAPSDWHLDPETNQVWFINSHCPGEGRLALYDWLEDAGFAASSEIDYVGIRLELFRRPG